MSTRTGVAPTYSIASTVAANVKGVVMTSSPGPTSSPASASLSASVPELQATAKPVPT